MTNHVMELTREADNNGHEWWVCPICGRSYMLKWNPWSRIVIEPGDETVPHSGGKGGLSISKMEILQ